MAKERRGKGRGTKDGIEETNNSAVYNTQVGQAEEVEHSIGVKEHFIQPGKETCTPQAKINKGTDFKEWQKRFKARFGYKPTGMSVEEMQQAVETL